MRAAAYEIATCNCCGAEAVACAHTHRYDEQRDRDLCYWYCRMCAPDLAHEPCRPA